MHSKRKVMSAGTLILVALSCGHAPKSFDSVSVKPPTTLDRESQVQQPDFASAFGAADLAIGRRRQELIAWAVAAAKEKPLIRPVEPSSTTTPLPVVSAATAPSSIDWPCVAEAETGSDFTMHGATYSTAYGMVNDIIYEYASPEVQQRVFSGTASEAEQTDIAARFAADHGTGGWGELTKSKCNL